MNARQKAKLYKKQLKELYEDYANSAVTAREVFDRLFTQLRKLEDSQGECRVVRVFNEPVEITDDIAIDMWEQLTYTNNFRQAVTFEGRVDPETGKYILAAELTVVKPKLSEQSEEE